jgi:hypothetical protein
MGHLQARRSDRAARNHARSASFGRGRAAVALCAVAASVLMVACGSDSSSTTGPGNNQKTPDGSYAISSINGTPLPVAIFSDTGGYKLEVMSGTITLTTAGQYSIITNYRETLATAGVSDLYTDSTGGTWLMPSGTTMVQFTNASDSTKDQAAWTSGQLTFVEPGVSPPQLTYVYKLK